MVKKYLGTFASLVLLNMLLWNWQINGYVASLSSEFSEFYLLIAAEINDLSINVWQTCNLIWSVQDAISIQWKQIHIHQ